MRPGLFSDQFAFCKNVVSRVLIGMCFMSHFW